MSGLIRAFEGHVDRVGRKGGEAQGGELDKVIEPIARLVVGEIALVAKNGEEAEGEDAKVEVEGLEGDQRGGGGDEEGYKER